MPKTIILTGATGFVGRHVAKELLRQGVKTIALARRPQALSDLIQEGLEVVTGDLSPSRASFDLPRADAVIHLAGLIKARNTKEFDDVNCGGTEILLNALGTKKDCRFILVSSISARGPNASPTGLDGTMPVSHYGRSKLAAEMLTLNRWPHSQTVIFRPPVVYGPGDTATLSLFRFLKHGIFPRIGKAPTRVSFVFVSDLAKFLVQAATSPKISLGPHYPEDGVSGYALTDFLAVAESVFGKRLRTPYVPLWVVERLSQASELWGRLSGTTVFFSHDKYAELKEPHWFCSPKSCFETFPLKNVTRLEEGLRTTKRWYEEQGWL
jgi:nucleoside-diphosphate-sugar epimerase